MSLFDERDETYEEERRRKETRERLDRSPSSGPVGSEEKSYDHSAPTSHDNRAKTRTTFFANEASNDVDDVHPAEMKVDYDYLAKLNDGLHDNERKSRKRKAEKKRDLEIFADRAKLTPVQTQDVFYLVESIDDLGSFHSEEVFLLAAITMVANIHGRRIRKEYDYDDLRESCNVNRKTIRKARQKIRDTEVVDYLQS